MGERQFGPYRLVRQIAVGGMAEIHLAKTRGIAGFEKFVALKMIHSNFAQDEQFIQMLIDEAKIAVQLQHVNIAQTFDLGRVGDTYYITMEYVDGADLYKVLRRGSEQDLDMPLDVCAFVAKEMATGLDHSHRKKGMDGAPLGIVHRDVSPQNVLISHAGEVKLVDFGIAKATMRARQTQVGVIKGKYYYMSPEQAWGDPLDHRSDIFSCGIVLYEMMTGQMLYLEEDLHRLLDMVRRANIAPPTRLRRDVPPQLEKIVMHALAKNPEDRYQSAVDLATDLERFLHTYSPVFTASKLSAHLRKAVGDPAPMATPEEPVARSPSMQTQPIDRRELASDRSDITDENSVIFRVDELSGGDTAREPARGKPSRDRSDDDSTASELPRGTAARRATPSPTEPPPLRPGLPRPPTGQPARARPPTAPIAPRGIPQVPTRVPAQIPTRVPAVPARGRPTTQAPPPPLPTRAPTPTPPPRPSITRAPTARPLPSEPPARPATAPPRGGFGPSATTVPADLGDPGDIEEMTAISAPPGFDAAVHADAPTARTNPISAAEGLDYGDYEPTMIDGGGSRGGGGALEPTDSEDGPTITRDGLGVPLAQPVQLSTSETMPRPHAELRSKMRPGVPAHPALSAHTPTPAVSELRKPRGSRRTPPSGVPAGGSVLQAIVGAAGNEPMPTASPRATSDGVPNRLSEGNTSDAPTHPGGPQGVPMPSPPPIPGQHALPTAYGPPGANVVTQPAIPAGPTASNMVLVAPPTPPPGSIPSAQLPPHLMGYGMPQAAQTISPIGYPPQGYPGQAYSPYGQPPMTFTKQMQAALDVDDIPQNYKLQEARSRKVIWAAALVALFVGGMVITAMVTRTSTGTPSAALVVDSMPPGARVSVDGVELADVTPVRFATRPGERHELVVIAPRHKPWTQAVVVPSTGGDVKLTAVLTATTYKLQVDSKPGGAEIWINGELRGVTPRVLEGLDPETVKRVELRLRDFPPMFRDIDWTGGDVASVNGEFGR